MATLSNCGKFLKPQLLSQGGNTLGGQGNDLGYSKNVEDVTMDNPQPSPKLSVETFLSMDAVHRLNGSG